MNFKTTSSIRTDSAMRARTLVRRLLLLAALALALAPQCFAQSADDYNKVEVYGGYSLGRFKSPAASLSFTDPTGATTTFNDPCGPAATAAFGANSQKFFCERRNFNGFDASVTYNFTRYLGIKGNVTGHFRTERFIDAFPPATQVTDTRERLYNFLAGVQVKDNSRAARFKPFAHALAGVAHYSDRAQQTIDLFPEFNFVDDDLVTAFALKVGGGIDIRAGRRIDIRAVEFDYNPFFAGEHHGATISGPFTFASHGKTAQNYTVGFGIVIH
jgi:Outer membrane protein beta-barrel domain